MNNIKVHNLFNNLEKDFFEICSEIDSFSGSILEWADELLETVEKEFTATKESSSFQLPKTPSERKTRNKKTRNALVSKCSIFNSTVDCNEVSNLNDTISTRTRAAQRLNITKESIIETRKEINIAEINLSETTFVVPQTTSTRTKPVIRNKNKESKILVSSSPIAQQSRSKISRALSESPKEHLSVRKISRTLSGSPVDVPSMKKALTEGRALDEKLKNKISETPPADSANHTDDEKVMKRSLSKSPPVRQSRRKISRTLSRSSSERQSRRKISRMEWENPVALSSENLAFGIPASGPDNQLNSLKVQRTSSRSPAVRSSRNVSAVQNNMSDTFEKNKNESVINKTITLKKDFKNSTSKISSTFVISHEEEIDGNDLTPRARNERFTRISKTSTPMVNKEKTPVVAAQKVSPKAIRDEPLTGLDVKEISVNGNHHGKSQSLTVEESEENLQPKKKRKLKKEEETFKENIEEMGETVRITRTKSKAIKKMMEENETKQVDLAQFAKKLLNRAKMTSLKKNQLASLLENNISTPKNGPGTTLPYGNLTAKSKYHLLLSNSKIKTPLATLPNSSVKIPKPSGEKTKNTKRDSSVENVVRSVTKLIKDDVLEREIKLKSKKEKEEEAALKREKVIKTKQEELKRKNELKHQLAMKQREKLEQEKYNNMIQSEKEKEERHKLILQERQMKLKEEAIKKKMLTQQKIAETNERRRLEEEARIAKLKEMEAEEERLALEKQREQEKQEKRAQERLAQKKAREEYEMQMKQELEAERLKAEKMSATKKFLLSASKLQSASKRQKFGILGEKKEWDYKPRNENDYGLEDEHSEVDSEDERPYDKSKHPVAWSKKIMAGKGPYVRILTLEMMCEYMPCYQKTPDIHKMFKMTPTKRIKRTSSAIWNTPSS